MQKWRESLIPVINEIREELRQVPLSKLAERSGAGIGEKRPGSKKNEIRIKLFDQTYLISYPQFKVTDSDDKECKEELQALLLHYLQAADGTPISGEWISFSELPNGKFYHRAFKSYSGDQLPPVFRNQLDKFFQICKNLGGNPLSIGDQAFSFQVLPRVRLAVVYWLGGEEFPDKAHILFDKSAGHYLPVDGLAQLGRMLTDRLIKAKEDIESDENSNNR